MTEIFGSPIMGGGGNGSGGTLTVTGVAGSTVTVSNADKSYTRTLDSTGKAMFKGLASGTWTLIMTNGVQTATRTVEITADYSVSIAYFAATINITYPAGSTCTATDGATTLTAPDTTGTWACVVPNTGTWTINCTDGSQAATNAVTISTDGESKSLVLSYRIDLFPSSTIGWGRTGWYGTASNNGGYVTIGSNTIVLTSESYHDWAAAATSSLIDVTNLSKISMTAKLVSSAGTITFSLGLSTVHGDADARNGLVSEVTMTAQHQQTVSQTISIDVSSLTGSYYVVIGGHTGSVAGNGGTLTVSNVWGS